MSKNRGLVQSSMGVYKTKYYIILCLLKRKKEKMRMRERERKKEGRKIHPYECLKRKVWKNMTCVT